MRNTKTGQSNPKIAITTAVLCLIFVVFVFVFYDLKANPFVQGITSLLVALAIAVVLFSAVPGSRVVKVPLGVAGAAGFYLLLLPQIQPFVFPFYSFTGYVARGNESRSENPSSFTPVEGANVEIKDTGLSSKTNSNGQFTIANVPSQITITHLIISWAGHSHTVETNKYPDKIFRIPEDPTVIKSSVFPVSSNEWAEGTRAECVSVDEKKFPSVAQFRLTKTVPNEEGFSNFVFRVWSDDEEIEILEARKQQPVKGQKVTEIDAGSNAQKWEVPTEGRTTTITVYVCLGSNRKKPSLSKSQLQSVYWFQKVG